MAVTYGKVVYSPYTMGGADHFSRSRRSFSSWSKDEYYFIDILSLSSKILPEERHVGLAEGNPLSPKDFVPIYPKIVFEQRMLP